jgi:hypothetical protein
MIEIVLLIGLCRNIGRKVRNRGRSAVGFQLMLVGMWFGGEFIGGVVGTIITTLADGQYTGPGLLAYIMALAGAGIGAWGAFKIVNSLSNPNDLRAFQVVMPPAHTPADEPPR